MYPVENLSPVRDQAAGHRQHDGHATVMQKTSACAFGLAGQWQVFSLKRAGVVLALCKHVRNRCKRPVGAADFTPTIALSFASLRGCFDPPPGRFFRRRRSQVQQAVAWRSNEFANRAVYDSKIGNLGRDSIRTLVGRKAAGNVTLHCDSPEVIRWGQFKTWNRQQFAWRQERASSQHQECSRQVFSKGNRGVVHRADRLSVAEESFAMCAVRCVPCRRHGRRRQCDTTVEQCDNGGLLDRGSVNGVGIRHQVSEWHESFAIVLIPVAEFSRCRVTTDR